MAHAHNARDDTPFDLTGNISENARKANDTFEDATGAITAEVGLYLFRGTPVTPGTTVRPPRRSRPVGRKLELETRQIVN